jgi:hypothetical protein
MTETNINEDNLSVKDNYWYSAKTKYGVIYIGIDRQSASAESNVDNLPNNLKKAVLLYKVEVLIRHVEDWLGCGLELIPAAIMPNSIYTIELHNISNDEEAGLDRIILGIQFNQMDKISDPTALFQQKISLETSSIPINLVISEFNMEKDQYESIQDGSILLLPNSFTGDWRIKIKSIIDHKMYRDGVLSNDIRTIIVDKQKLHERSKKSQQIHRINNQDGSYKSITVILHEPILIPLNSLLGWNNENSILLDQSLRHYKAEVRCDSNLIATGYLISVANGYGLDINT